MRDYAKLVKSMRCCAEYAGCLKCDRFKSGFTCAHDLLNDSADAIEELLAAVPHWISVEERLPEENKNYLYYGVFLPLGVKAMDMCRFDGVRWRTSSDVEITHWMPLPAPPKEVE